MKAWIFLSPVFAPNCTMLRPKGEVIQFKGGKTVITSKEDYDYLMEQVSAGLCHIPPEDHEVDTDDLSIEGQRKKIEREAIEKYLAQQKAALNPEANVSSSEAGALAPSSSVQVKGVTLQQTLERKLK